jgi:hypothetical protein
MTPRRRLAQQSGENTAGMRRAVRRATHDL